jgi:hypothetical protein
MPKKKGTKHAESAPPVIDPTWKAAWETEDNYWFENFSSRPYALGPDWYDRFRPAFRYGFESAQHHMGREWDDAEPDLRRGWETYEHRGTNPLPWDEIKDGVRDAWARGRESLREADQRTRPRAPEK